MQGGDLPFSKQLPLQLHWLLFSLSYKMWPNPRPSPSILPSGEGVHTPAPSLSAILSCSIAVFLYLLQRSEKQINEKKDPIILRLDSAWVMGRGSRSIK